MFFLFHFFKVIQAKLRQFKGCSLTVDEKIIRNYRLPGWGAIRKRPLIRPFQTKVISEQTILDQSNLWSHWSTLETPCAPKVRSKLSLIRLSRRKWPLIRPKSDHCPDGCATMAQTEPRPSYRRLCAQNHFLSDYCGFKSYSWSDYCALEITSDQTLLGSK